MEFPLWFLNWDFEKFLSFTVKVVRNSAFADKWELFSAFKILPLSSKQTKKEITFHNSYDNQMVLSNHEKSIEKIMTHIP